jgi:hypothetical protein
VLSQSASSQQTNAAELSEGIPHLATDPKPEDRVTVKNVQPSGCYPLRDGLKPGDVVRLIEFNCGHWTVELRDGRHTRIYMLNIDQIVLCALLFH